MTIQITPLDHWISQKIGQSGRLNRAILEEYQLAKLQETLTLARSKSPFYQKLLANSPGEIKKTSDLEKFPFTTARDILDQGLQFLCVSQDEIERVVTLDTTGTTGIPKRLYFTREDQELTVDFFHVGMSTFTQPGDNVLILLPGERPGSVGDLLAVGLKRLGANSIKHGIVRDFEQTLQVIRNEKVDVLVGIPTQVLGLARYGRGIHLKSVLLSTDHAVPALRSAIETAWGCKVYDHYGMTEMGLGGGVECLAQQGMHLREADLYFEIINPATGELVADGESGEVVFTTLTRKGMPLIRYRTGDISRFLPEKCPCLTELKLLESIYSRRSDLITIENWGKLSITDLDEILFSFESIYDYESDFSKMDGICTLALKIYLKDLEVQIEKRIKEKIANLPVLRQLTNDNKLILQIEVAEGLKVMDRPVKRTVC